jgi:hypothetical protein
MINFLTTAEDKHIMFVIPYIYNILTRVPDSFAEIYVPDSAQWIKGNKSAYEALRDYNESFVILDLPEFAPKRKITPNTKRFLIESVIKESDVTYIGDVDILIFDPDIEQFHTKQMTANNTCFSNIVRQNTNRLTGLHGVHTKDWYEKTRKIRNKIKDTGCDEQTLYAIAKKAVGTPEHLTKNNTRPVHGLHLSLNRTPYTKPSWRLGKYRQEYGTMKSSYSYKHMYPHFAREYKELMSTVDEWYQSTARHTPSKEAPAAGTDST